MSVRSRNRWMSFRVPLQSLKALRVDHSGSYFEILTERIFKLESDPCPPLVDHMFQVRRNNFNLRNFQKVGNNKRTR